MKIFRALLFGLPALLILSTSCRTNSGPASTSTGRAYEVLVIGPRPLWDGPLGDTLRAVLLEEVPMLNQREPLMDPVPIVPSGFVNIIQKHRNIIDLEIGPDYPEPAIKLANNVYASPQLIVQISGPDEASVIDYTWEHRSELIKVFEIAERDRYVGYASRQNEPKVKERVQEKFGFQFSVPKGYTIRNDEKDFLWISFELPLVSQGVVIYRYPYTGEKAFTGDSLINRRNQFVARIPGPADGSFMITAPEETTLEYRRIDGRLWAEMRGFWDVQGDFMGGPFVSFSTLDAASGEIVCIDCYVFSPRHHKRNYVREMEHLVHTVKFPGDAQPQTTVQ